MNIEEFREQYRNVSQKQKINICCDVCGTEHCIHREKAEQNILQHGFYIDRSCSMKRSHEENPRGDETREKQRQGRLGKKQSPETRLKMAEAKKAFYQTPRGEALKRKLSWLAARGHAEHKYENAKRTGWHLSSKTDEFMFYGSSYELRLCWELDQDPAVKRYDTQVEYHVEDRGRCLDCLIVFKNGRKKAIEVKPKSRLNEQENIDQIEDSRTHAESQGWSFQLLTEDHFGMTEEQLRDWADQFRTETGFFDWVEFRKEKNREKANRHYRNVIAQDMVTVWCDYCGGNHEALRLRHDKNVARNGRYICECEGGHIAGSKPKKKKDNPHAAEGKKKCNRCHVVKPFDEFGVDKTKSDGYATRCKQCRAEVAAYQRRVGREDC